MTAPVLHHWQWGLWGAHCVVCPCRNLLGYPEDPWHNHCEEVTSEELYTRQLMEMLRA
jgi:hypothetical protein